MIVYPSQNRLRGYSQYIFVQAHLTGLTEDQIEVLQRLGHPKTLTLVQFLRLLSLRYRYISNGRVRKLSDCRVVDGFEHAPSGILERGIAGDAVENEDRFNGFGSTIVVSFSQY